MRIIHHTPHLIQLTRFAALFPMNCYLVVEGDGLTLVDSTMSSPAGEVAAIVEELGVELRRVALTHAHADHVGGVGRTAGALPADRGLARKARRAGFLQVRGRRCRASRGPP